MGVMKQDDFMKDKSEPGKYFLFLFVLR